MAIEKTKSNMGVAQIERWLLRQSLPNSAYAHQGLSKAAFYNNRSRIVTTVRYYL